MLKTKETLDANIVEFRKIYDSIKIKKTRKENILRLQEEAEKIEVESAKREFKSNIEMAVLFTEINAVVNITKINWDNLKRVIKLYKKIKTNFIDKEGEFKTEISAVYTGSEQSDFNYNIMLETTLKEVAKVYTKEKMVEFDQVLKIAEKLSEKDIRKLIKALTLNIEDTRGYRGRLMPLVTTV